MTAMNHDEAGALRHRLPVIGALVLTAVLVILAVPNQQAISNRVFDTFVGGVEQLPAGPIRDGILRDNHIDPHYTGPLSPSDQSRAEVTR